MNALDRTEWDFSEVEDSEVIAACGYEYAREVPGTDLSKAWLQIEAKGRRRLKSRWASIAMGMWLPDAIRSVAIDEAADWLELQADLSGQGHDSGSSTNAIAIMRIDLASYTDAELAGAFLKQVAEMRIAHSAPAPEAKGRRTALFRIHLYNLALMRLRSEIPFIEIVKTLTRHPLCFFQPGEPHDSIRKKLADRCTRARAYFTQRYRDGETPKHWASLLERGGA